MSSQDFLFSDGHDLRVADVVPNAFRRRRQLLVRYLSGPNLSDLIPQSVEIVSLHRQLLQELGQRLRRDGAHFDESRVVSVTQPSAMLLKPTTSNLINQK